MLTKDIGCAVVIEGVSVAKLFGHPTDNLPVRQSLARQGQKGALSRDTPFRVSDGTVLFTPCCRRQLNVRQTQRVCIRNTVRHHYMITTGKGANDPV